MTYLQDHLDPRKPHALAGITVMDFTRVLAGSNTAATRSGRFETAGVPVGIVLNADNTRKLEQIAVRGMVKNVKGRDVPRTPLKFGFYNSVGTMIPSPALDNRGAAIRAEFAPQLVS